MWQTVFGPGTNGRNRPVIYKPVRQRERPSVFAEPRTIRERSIVPSVLPQRIHLRLGEQASASRYNGVPAILTPRSEGPVRHDVRVAVHRG